MVVIREQLKTMRKVKARETRVLKKVNKMPWTAKKTFNNQEDFGEVSELVTGVRKKIVTFSWTCDEKTAVRELCSGRRIQLIKKEAM